jgi:hypothetical protein
MRRFIIILCLVALWLMQTAFQPKEPVPASKVATVPQTSLSVPPPPKAEKPPAARKPLQITSKGKIRLKPGESAVLGYWEIAPGMNGMAIVTPETTPEGHVKMTSKLLHLSDDAVSGADAKDLFPDIFDFENYSAIAPERLRGLQSTLQSTRGVDMLTTPTVVTLPGQHASISIGNSNESTLSLSLQADPVAEDGGYDLSLELQRQE